MYNISKHKRQTMKQIVKIFVVLFIFIINQGSANHLGLNTYNTKNVVDELIYIEKNIKPIDKKYKKRILITGSTAGIGQLAAKYLIKRGHDVVVHARNTQRSDDVKRDLPNLKAVVIGDLSNLEQTKKLANDINALGNFDVIIHNAGVYGASSKEMLNVNSLSPYILTSLVNKPKSLIFITSSIHISGDLKLQEIQSKNPKINYSDTKLQILTFAMAVSRYWDNVKVNAIRPGWVPTLMGFHDSLYATDDLRLAYMTYVYLAENLDKDTNVTGKYFFQSKEENSFNKIIYDENSQDELIKAYEKATFVSFPK